MIFRQLPTPVLSNNGPQPKLQNEVIYASTIGKYHYPNHTTPYLLIANFKASGYYRVNNRHISVNDKLFYFLNAGDHLEIDFKNDTALDTLLILFNEEFVNSWINYRQTKLDSLLNDSIAAANGDWSVPNIPFEYNAAIVNQLNRVRTCAQRADMDAILFELLEEFWVSKESLTNQVKNIHAKRKSTREEIYKRLLMAKIFMHDNFTDSPTVDVIATEACLDKFHFLKSFKTLFGVTPHQYLIKLKVEHAYSLLASGQYTVMEVCHRVGFESLGTFSNLFKKYYQITPSELSKGPKR